MTIKNVTPVKKTIVKPELSWGDLHPGCAYRIVSGFRDSAWRGAVGVFCGIPDSQTSPERLQMLLPSPQGYPAPGQGWRRADYESLRFEPVTLEVAVKDAA